MKNLYPRLFSFALLVCLFANRGTAQTITIDNSLLETGPYGQGCSIAAPIMIDGCFATNNIFRLYLSDASGNFASETLIGSYTAFYTTFVNGVIPTTRPAGSGYRIRVKSTSPAVTSAASSPIQINTYAATLNSLADPQLSSRILSPQLAYGWCSSVQQQTGFVMINGSTTGAVATASIKNEINGSVQTNLPYDASNQLSLNLNRHYYTFINKAAKDGVIATKAYFIINSPNKLGLSTDGEQQGCLPDTLRFQMGTDTTSGIGNNFPGITYQIDWGDGTALELFTQCNLMSASGILKHYYVGVSCGRPNITFNVTTTLLNPWFNNTGTATQRNCDQPQVVSRAKIFKKPEAKFSFPNPACVNTPVTFANNTDPGQAQFGTQCINKADYRWYINGVLVQTNIQATPPPSMTYTFTAVGKYEIKLMVDNGSCEISTKIDSICIEPKPTPDFKMNGVDSLASCAPLNIATTNLTTSNAVCQALGYAWLVIDSMGNTIAPGTGVFTISPNNTDKTPSFVFLKEGKYKIRLTVTNVCGGIVKEKPVIIIGTTKATLPGNKAYCGKQTINFLNDANHKPDYNITIGAETYGWVITGGTYSFIGGTNAASPYPQIKFNDYGTYTVKVNFSNMCGTATSIQLITFNEPVTATVTSNKNISICYNDSIINVTATSSGPADSTRWFTTGTGSFVNRNLLSTTYKLSNADKLAGSIKLYFKTFIQKPTACDDVSDTINVTILPHNHITSDTTKKICSGTNIAYLPTALISGSTFNWTSSIISGTVTGNAATGSGNINDVLTNTSFNTDAIVRYIITPTKASCVGDTFSFYAIVKPLPDLTAAPVADTICSGSNAIINMGSSAPNTKYTWSSTVSGGTVTGNTNQATQVSTTSISNALVNSGTTYATVTYTIKVFGETGCEGQTETVKVVVRPNPTIADAGLDKKLCNQTSITLAGNNPVAGTGVWTQAAGPAVTFANPNAYNTIVNGLTGNNTYRFVWSINAGGSCGAVTDTVTIINRPAVTIANAGADIVICDFNALSVHTTTLNANLNSTRTYETGTWSIYSQPTGGNGGFSLLSNPNAVFTFQKTGNYKLVWTISNDVGCTPSSDTVEINVYPKPVAGVTAPTNAITCNGTDVTINLQSYTGIIKKWQYNTNPINDNIWVDTLVTNPSITFQNLQDTILVRCIVSGGGEANGCPSFDTSVYSFIAVNPKTLGGNTNDDAVVCKGDNNGVVALTNHTGAVQRWEFSINNGSSWFMINNTTTTQSYTNLTANTLYRAVVQSGVCPPKYSDTTSITVVEPVTASNAGVDQKLCNQSTITLNGNTPVNGTGTWLQVNGSPVSFTNASLSNTTVTGLQGNQLYKFVWKIAGLGNCPPSTDTVIVINRPATTQANAGMDKTVCDFTATSNNNILLNANIDNTRTFETGKWNVIEQPTSSSAYLDDNTKHDALFTFSKAGIYKLEWSINNDAGCPPTKDTIVINVFDKPVAGIVAGSPITACYGSTVTASINTFTGNIKKWQYNPAPFNDNIWIDATGTTSTINFNNAQDSFAVRVIIESAGAAFGCNSTAVSDSVIFNITPKTIPGKVTGNATVCELANTGNINLTNYAGNIVKWQSTIDNGLSWIDISTTSAIVHYNNLAHTIWYRAVVQSGVCPTLFSDTAIVTVAPKVTPAIAGLDKQLCGETSVQLNGNSGASTETGLWQQVSGPSTASIVTANTANTTVNSLIDGIYTFEWVLSNNVCPATKDTVVITNYPSLQNTINATNIMVCNGQPVNITGYAATGGNGTYTYQWQQSVDSINWVNIASANSINYSFVATDTLFIRRVVSSDPCNKISDVIKVLVQKPITNNLIGSNQSICINTVPLLVTGTLPGGADGNYQYQWQQSTDGGNTWSDITNATVRDYQPTVLTQSVRYRRIVFSQLCNGQQQSISGVVSITVNPDAKAQWSITHNTDCAPFNINTTVINTSVYPDKNGVYEWYVNGSLLGTGENFPGYVITTANDSVVIKLKTVSRFGCINDSISTKFYTIPKPVPAFDITDTIGCGPLSIGFANNTANTSLYHFKWDFGNGQTSTQSNPAAIVFNQAIANVDTVYTIRMSAYTSCDSITINRSVRVQSKPMARFLPSKVTGCSPMTVTFTNTSIAAVATYYWDFGDGTTIVATNKNQVQHTFYTGTATMFNVKLKVTNGCGSDSLVYPIDVQQNSILLNFSIANDNKGCVPYTAKFINGSIGATGFNWDFGDGTIINTVKNLDTIYHTYYTVGDYTPVLKATNGCSDTTGNKTLFANRKPVVNFTALPTTVCLGDSVHFTNLTDTATTYVWKFDDGFTSNQFSPVHAYNIAGVFTAKLQATRLFNNGGSCVDSSNRIVTVLAKQPGAFNVSDTLGKCTPFSVTFTNLSLPSAFTTWDYGNGVVDTGDVVIHTFNTVGTYTVQLHAQSIGGCKYEAQKTIKVLGPSGNFNYDNGFICGNKPVRFETNTQNVDSVKWNFGDGNTFVTTGNIVYHAFSQPGVYIPKVELIAGGTCRVPLNGIDTVKVDYIKAGYTSTIQNYCGYSTVNFMDTSRTYFGVNQYYWTFGDGGTSGLASPQHQYNSSNTWATQLVIKTNSGCFDTAYNPFFLQVPQLPHAAIQSDTVGCVNETLHFNAVVNSLDAVGYYKWNFTNGVTTANTTVATQFAVAGVQTAQLIIGTTNGCYDTAYKQVRINPNPFVRTNQDMQICRGQSTMLNATGASSYTWSPTQNLSCSTCANTLSAPQSTTQYVVSGTNQFGCYGYDTVIVNVAQPFAVSITSNDTLCLGQSTTLHAQGAYSYQWFPSGGLTSTTASAPVASPSITTKYRVIGLDEFNCFRDTAYVTVAVGQYPVVNIGPDKVMQTGDYLPLKATFTNGPITQWHWGSGDFNCVTCAEPVALIKNNACYYVEAKNQYGCAGRDTMCVKVFFNGGQVYIPNAFTPDGDGINDVFMVRGKGIKTVKSFRIFNRWGQVVFERANFAANDARYGWDGRVNGIPASPDVFVYTCDVVAENDEQYSTKGNVTILK